jgi:hypothetical protein
LSSRLSLPPSSPRLSQLHRLNLSRAGITQTTMRLTLPLTHPATPTRIRLSLFPISRSTFLPLILVHSSWCSTVASLRLCPNVYKPEDAKSERKLKHSISRSRKQRVPGEGSPYTPLEVSVVWHSFAMNDTTEGGFMSYVPWQSLPIDRFLTSMAQIPSYAEIS